jgi:putative hemolysin
MSAIIIIALCLLLNALLSAMEMSFVSVSKPQLKLLATQGQKHAQSLLQLRGNPERTLSVLQIGITLVGAISAAVGGVGADEALSPFIQQQFQVKESLADTIAIIAAVLPITFLSVVLGELVPKTLAISDPMKIALRSAPILVMGDRVLSPIVSVLEGSTRYVARLFRKSNRTASDGSSSNEVNLDHLSEVHQQYVLNLYHIENLRMKDIMLPWEKVSRLSKPMTTNDVLGLVVASGHTRLPVCDDNNFVGILHTKEFMAYLSTGAENWFSLIRPGLKVRDTDSILKILRQMQEKRSHMSIVHDREGAVVGLATLEDIIEEIVGDIFDEDDDGAIKRMLANTLAMAGRTPRRS